VHSQWGAEVGVGFGVVGLVPDRRALCGNGHLRRPLGEQGGTDVGRAV
jgi:hypothetical protein